MSHHHFIPASTSRTEEICAPGKGVRIAPACGGSVESQIERSTYLIAQRLGCSPQAIQRLAGIAPTSSNNASLSSLMHSTTATSTSNQTTPRGVMMSTTTTTPRNNKNNNNKASKIEFDDPSTNLPSSPTRRQMHGNNNNNTNPMITSVKKEIDDIKPLSLPALPAHFQSQSARQAQQNLEKNQKESQGGGGGGGSGGLTIAQQQAAFLDDAEAARQFAAQLRYRDAMLQQRKGPAVGQYYVPDIIGADNKNAANFYSRAPHVSLDGQTPRSTRFMFNIDLFENGAKRPGPGEYNVSTSSARNGGRGGTIGGRDRGMRKRLPMERLNARALVDPKSMKKSNKNTTSAF